MGNEDTQTFSVKIDSDAAEVGREGAQSLEQFAEAIKTSEERVKEYSASLRRLKGSSDDVKAAKSKLKTAIDAEKNAISQNNLALLRSGSSMTKLAEKTKLLGEQKERAKKQTESMKAAIEKTGGPVEALIGKFDGLKSITSGLGGALGLATVGALAAVAAVAALAAGVIAATVAFAKFAFETRAAERSLNLFRVAASGSAENGVHMGEQIDALAKKIPASRNELNKLGNELAKTRLRGQTYVDTFNAIGQASSALGEDVGGKLKEIATRGQLMGNFSLGSLELEGTGLHSEDVYAAYAKRMNISLPKARELMNMGRVQLADGAAALRDAVEKNVAGINLQRLKDPEVAIEKFKDTLKSLTKDINIDPLLEDLQSFFGLFDSESSVTGSAIKSMITMLGSGMVDAVHGSAPVAKNFVRGLVMGALDVGIAYYQLKLGIKKAIHDTFGNKSLTGKIDGMKAALMAGKFAAGALAASFGLIAANVLLLATPLIVGGTAVAWVITKFRALKKTLLGISWKDIGANILDGLVGPLRKGAGYVQTIAGGLAKAVKKGVADPLGIASPSKVMQQYAKWTVDPFVGGIAAGVPKAAAALDDFVAPSMKGGTRIGGSASVVMHVHINATQEVAKELAVPSVLEQMRRAVADVLRTAGMQTEAV